MKYAVFVYSIPIDESVGPIEQEGIDAGLFEPVTPATQLAELIAHEGVQREPYILDELHVGILEAGLTTWHKESNA